LNDTPAQRRRGGWRWLLPAIVIALLGGHTAYWFVTMHALERGLDIGLAQRRQAGWSAQFGPPARAGYPFSAELAIPDMRILATGAENISWQAERVRLRIALWHPQQLNIETAGAQTLRLADGAPMPFRADRLHVVIPIEPGFPRWGEASSAQLRARIPMPDGPAGLMVGQIQAGIGLHPAALEGEAAVTLRLAAAAIQLPDPTRWALGPDIATLDLEARLGGPLPRLDLSLGNKSLPDAAGQWRDAGGTLEIDRLHLRWGPLELNTSATLALDASLQPMGSGTVRMRGQAAALDALTEAGIIKPAAAKMARTILALLAKPTAPTSGAAAMAEQPVELPVSVQERRLMLRQFPLTRLPVLRWPGQ
jgi:hypothetical protein